MKKEFSAASVSALQQVFDEVELLPLPDGGQADDGLHLDFHRSAEELSAVITRRVLVDGRPCLLRLTGQIAPQAFRAITREAQMFREDLTRDFLTGTFNLAYWQDTVAAQVAACAAAGRPAGIALVDIDGLTGLNTAYGHADADQLIGYVANLWKHYYNEGTEKLVCRIGGGRLGIYCAGLTARELENQLRWLYGNMNLVCTSTEGMLRRIPFTLSIACAGLDEANGSALADLTALAQQRLAAVQAAGGNAVAALL